MSNAKLNSKLPKFDENSGPSYFQCYTSGQDVLFDQIETVDDISFPESASSAIITVHTPIGKSVNVEVSLLTIAGVEITEVSFDTSLSALYDNFAELLKDAILSRFPFWTNTPFNQLTAMLRENFYSTFDLLPDITAVDAMVKRELRDPKSDLSLVLNKPNFTLTKNCGLQLTTIDPTRPPMSWLPWEGHRNFHDLSNLKLEYVPMSNANEIKTEIISRTSILYRTETDVHLVDEDAFLFEDQISHFVIKSVTRISRDEIDGSATCSSEHTITYRSIHEEGLFTDLFVKEDEVQVPGLENGKVPELDKEYFIEFVSSNFSYGINREYYQAIATRFKKDYGIDIALSKVHYVLTRPQIEPKSDRYEYIEYSGTCRNTPMTDEILFNCRAVPVKGFYAINAVKGLISPVTTVNDSETLESEYKFVASPFFVLMPKDSNYMLDKDKPVSFIAQSSDCEPEKTSDVGLKYSLETIMADLDREISPVDDIEYTFTSWLVVMYIRSMHGDLDDDQAVTYPEDLNTMLSLYYRGEMSGLYLFTFEDTLEYLEVILAIRTLCTFFEAHPNLKTYFYAALSVYRHSYLHRRSSLNDEAVTAAQDTIDRIHCGAMGLAYYGLWSKQVGQLTWDDIYVPLMSHPEIPEEEYERYNEDGAQFKLHRETFLDLLENYKSDWSLDVVQLLK